MSLMPLVYDRSLREVRDALHSINMSMDWQFVWTQTHNRRHRPIFELLEYLNKGL
jgi:hypothetical protein